jgi:Protein of unknown function (DUF3040)
MLSRTRLESEHDVRCVRLLQWLSGVGLADSGHQLATAPRSRRSARTESSFVACTIGHQSQVLTRDELRVLAELESSMREADRGFAGRLGRSRAPWRSRLGELCAPVACAMFVVGIVVTIFELL